MTVDTRRVVRAPWLKVGPAQRRRRWGADQAGRAVIRVAGPTNSPLSDAAEQGHR